MPTSSVLSRASRITVLFVESDADLRFVFQSIAAGEGLGVELAADGREAIILANLLSPDVIVLDLGLPDLDGLEVARRLRASPRTGHIPIVVASGSHRGRPGLARARGCDERPSKPRAGELVRLIGLIALRSRRADVRPGGTNADAEGPPVPVAPRSHVRLSSPDRHHQGARS